MGLDDFTPVESSEGGGQSSEISEVFKEAFKKGSAGIKRTQKDEKKAKKHDVLLAGFLVKLIIDKKYDSLLNTLFKCLHIGFPSNFLLGILSLVYIEVSNEIRSISGKKLIHFEYTSKETIEFDDNNIDPLMRVRINSWVEDIIDIISIEYSHVHTKKLIELLKNERNIIIHLTSEIFTFLLKNSNINISKIKSESISDFILEQIHLEISKLQLENI